MPFNFPCISKLFCAATLCALLAGCSTAPPSDVANNATGNAVSSTPGDNTQTVNYANSPQGLSGKLKENYVDFSFDYPTTWQIKETGQSADAQNFVKVAREPVDKSQDKSAGEFTIENFAVGYFSPSGNAAKDASVFPKLVQQLSDQLKTGFPEYKKLSEGKTKIGTLDGYEFRFESNIKDTKKKDLKLWGRVVFLPNPNSAQNGVTLIMLASNLAPEIKSAADVGAKGQLPTLLKSFKFVASSKDE